MMRFLELTQPVPGTPVGVQQEAADTEFPALARSAGFQFWQPGDHVPPTGIWLLIGVATYSTEDMKFLDGVAEDLKRSQLPSSHVAVFNAGNISTMAEYNAFVPGIGDVYQTPVVGLWNDGELSSKAWGHRGRELVLEVIRPRSINRSPSQVPSTTSQTLPRISATCIGHSSPLGPERVPEPVRWINLIMLCAWHAGLKSTLR